MNMHAVLQPAELRRVFGAFLTGVTALAGFVDGTPVPEVSPLVFHGSRFSRLQRAA